MGITIGLTGNGGRGPTAQERVGRRDMDTRTSIQYLQTLCEGLAYAENQGVREYADMASAAFVAIARILGILADELPE